MNIFEFWIFLIKFLYLSFKKLTIIVLSFKIYKKIKTYLLNFMYLQ